MKELILSTGHIAIVDRDDYDRVSALRWHGKRYPNTTYAITTIRRHKVRLHRFILGVSDPLIEVDHINGNGLDCRRENLRLCTRSQNMANTKVPCNSTSGLKGVSWRKDRQKWAATIHVNRQTVHLGIFNDPHEAAKTYDAAARDYFGEFARTNFPAVGRDA